MAIRRRYRAAWFAFAAALGFVHAPAKAETSIVVDVATNKVLSAKSASMRWYPASTTKLMTAYVALKAVEEKRASLDMPVVMTRLAAAQAPSKMGYAAGSVMRLDAALRMMLVKSANDVSVAIGTALGEGSLERFVAMMNADAAALGMADTRFVNPNGLPAPGQYSSAKDLAILGARIRSEFPAFAEFFGTEAISTGKTMLRNTNGLLGRFDGADGMKTGYICASGFNLVGSATRNGRTLVAVVLGAPGPIVRDRTIAELLEEGFRADPAAPDHVSLTEMPVSSGAPMDISAAICSPAGQKDRANERQAEAARPDRNSGSPFMHEMTRPPSIVQVSLGGASARGEIEAGIMQIAAYGIPLPTPRPDPALAAVPADQESPSLPSASVPGTEADGAAPAVADPSKGPSGIAAAPSDPELSPGTEGAAN